MFFSHFGRLLFASFSEFLELAQDGVLDMLLDVGFFVLDLGELVGIGEEVVDLAMAGFICTDCQHNISVGCSGGEGIIFGDFKRCLSFLPVL